MDREPSAAITRMWINQPSTLQPLHHLHGVRVLAAPDTDACARAYFLSGDAVSMQIPHASLSDGWPASSTPNAPRGTADPVIATTPAGTVVFEDSGTDA